MKRTAGTEQSQGNRSRHRRADNAAVEQPVTTPADTANPPEVTDHVGDVAFDEEGSALPEPGRIHAVSAPRISEQVGAARHPNGRRT